MFPDLRGGTNIKHFNTSKNNSISSSVGGIAKGKRLTNSEKKMKEGNLRFHYITLLKKMVKKEDGACSILGFICRDKRDDGLYI